VANNTSNKPAADRPFRKRVRATRDGFFAGQRVPVGRTFTITSEKQFSSNWMEEVDPSAPDELAAITHPRRKQPGELPKDAPAAPLPRTRGEVAQGTNTAPASTPGDEVI
jgi:hypothetical protein